MLAVGGGRPASTSSDCGCCERSGRLKFWWVEAASMQVPERAVAVVLGLAAAGVAVFVGAPVVAALSALAVYAGTGFYATRHPDVLWGDRRSGPDRVAGGFAGGLTFGLVGLVQAGVAPWVLLTAIGLCGFGFVAGVAWARDDGTSDPTA